MGLYNPGFEEARPRQDSNLRTRFRRPVLYPLSYGGGSPDATPSPGQPPNLLITSSGCLRQGSTLTVVRSH